MSNYNPEVLKNITLVLLAASLLVGCGATQTVEKKPIPEEPVTEEAAAEEISSDDVDLDEPWRQAYLDFLNTDEEIAPYVQGDYGFSFTLIYLDDDDIPEMFIDTGVEAGGQYIVGYYDGEVVEEHFSRIGSQYIEKSGLVYTDTGHMDYYPVDITKYENGKFTVIGSGLYYVSEEDWEKMTTDENYPYTLTYEWEGETVTKEQFDEEVNKLYDLNQSVTPDNFTTYKEFTYMLQTGKWTSYDHMYEFIVADVTWPEAQEACRQKGGYLATVTCLDEAQRIASLMKEQGLEDNVMYVGFRNCERVGDDWYNDRWILADGSYEDVMPAIYDYWRYQWPDDNSSNEWRVERDETDCGLAKFSTKTNMIYIFEAPDELLKVSPQYAGKMGYICEYD